MRRLDPEKFCRGVPMVLEMMLLEAEKEQIDLLYGA